MKLHRIDANHVAFHCPGCEGGHMVRISGDQPVWDWNGSEEHPTFVPSIRVRWDSELGPQTCHSFVKSGEIQFLADSTHKLAGKTVEIPEWES